MDSFTQDRHDFFKGLVASGISERQADAIAEGFPKLSLQDVATKADLAELETRLTARMATFIGIAVALQSVIIAVLQFWR